MYIRVVLCEQLAAVPLAGPRAQLVEQLQLVGRAGRAGRAGGAVRGAAGRAARRAALRRGPARGMPSLYC